MPLSNEQTELVRFLTRMVESMGRSDENDGGRTIQRTSSLVADLSAQVAELGCIPYARQRVGTRNVGEAGAVSMEPGIASQFDLPEHVVDFDAVPFLSAKSARAFARPDVMLKEEEEVGVLPKVQGSTTRPELLKLAGRWDAIGRLLVVPDEEVDGRDRAEVFGVIKKEGTAADAPVIRQIINRKRRNQRELGLRGRSLGMPHAVFVLPAPPGAIEGGLGFG